MPPVLRRAWFVDHSPGRGFSILIPTPTPVPCSFSAPPIDLGLTSGGTSSSAWGTSSDGLVVVGFGVDSGGAQRALQWVGGVAGTPTNLGGLAGYTLAYAHGCSSNGSIVVGACSVAGQIHATVWTSGTPTALAELPTATASQAEYCSSDGSIICGSCTVSGIRNAVFWTNGVITNLGNLGSDTDAFGVSADGHVVVGEGNNGAGTNHAYSWTNGGAPVQLAEFPGEVAARAFKCSSDGSIIVGRANKSGETRAVYWDGTGIHDLGALNPAGGNSVATGVNLAGTKICGYAEEAPGGTANTWPIVWNLGVLTQLAIGTVTGSELVTNGAFAGSATGWTLGGDTAYASNHVTSTYNGGDPTITQATIATVSGTIYEVAFDVSAQSPAGVGLFFYFNNNSYFAAGGYQNGSHSAIFKADFTGTDTLTLDNFNFSFGHTAGDTWTVDNVSIKAMTCTAQPSINMQVQNMSADGEAIVGQGNYNSGAFPIGAIEWLCV